MKASGLSVGGISVAIVSRLTTRTKGSTTQQSATAAHLRDGALKHISRSITAVAVPALRV